MRRWKLKETASKRPLDLLINVDSLFQPNKIRPRESFQMSSFLFFSKPWSSGMVLLLTLLSGSISGLSRMKEQSPLPGISRCIDVVLAVSGSGNTAKPKAQLIWFLRCCQVLHLCLWASDALQCFIQSYLGQTSKLRLSASLFLYLFAINFSRITPYNHLKVFFPLGRLQWKLDFRYMSFKKYTFYLMNSVYFVSKL